MSARRTQVEPKPKQRNQKNPRRVSVDTSTSPNRPSRLRSSPPLRPSVERATQVTQTARAPRSVRNTPTVSSERSLASCPTVRASIPGSSLSRGRGRQSPHHASDGRPLPSFASPLRGKRKHIKQFEAEVLRHGAPETAHNAVSESLLSL